jgi:hypothetical protein
MLVIVNHFVQHCLQSNDQLLQQAYFCAEEAT